MTGVALGPRAGNLPAEVTSFVGRRAELAAVGRLLAASRLVTLTGVGGVGKTRLALRAAAEARCSFPDGVWVVELSGVHDTELLVHAVTAALGLPGRSARTQLDELAGHLAERTLLLVLDTCDHLVDACALLAEVLLPAAPGLRILATSREPLDVPGEHLVQVSPLPRAEAGVAAPGDSVVLFAERAAAVAQGFSVTAENAAAVTRLCDRLDGLPLAIELAAVQTRALSVDQIAAQLDDRFRLTRGRRTTVGRHQTLRAAIGWSHELCTPPERVLWARLSVFPGDFDLEAAERVCADAEVPVAEVLDLVVRLVDKSIVQAERRPAGTRYRLLDTIREYGAEELARLDGTGTFGARHRDWFAELADAGLSGMSGHEQRAWSERLAREYPHLQGALEYSLTTPGEERAGLRMAASLWPLWVSRGLLHEGRHWLSRALAAVPEPCFERAQGLVAALAIAVLQGDRDWVNALAPEARLLSARFGAEDLGEWSPLSQLGILEGVLALDHDPARGRDLLAAAWANHRGPGHRHPMTLMALPLLAGACCVLGELDQAAAYGAECREIAAGYGDRWTESYAMWTLALVAWARREHAEARTLARTCLRVKDEIDDGVGRVMTLDLLTWCAVSLGDHGTAARLLGVTERLWEGFGRSAFGWRDLAELRDWAEARSRRALGEDAYTEAVRAGRELGREAVLAEALDDPPVRTAVRGRAAVKIAGNGRDPLSRREREVAELVAEGLSNREIAERLVIAKRTADSHVEHILGKLGMSSRTQIATWVTAHR